MIDRLLQLLQSYTWYEVLIEMLVIGAIVYLIFKFLQGTRGAGIIKGVAVVLVVVTLVIRLLGASDAFGRLNFIYDRFLGLLAILLIVVFQPELRQAMVRLGHTRMLRPNRSNVPEVVEAVADAARFLSKNQFGAVIAIERAIQLGGLVESGQMLDARVSAPLLEAIFWPNSPLHDLGVVIRGDRIVAAGVQFPLVEEGVLPGQYGSRHRAACGVSLDCDCLVVIVSEESGAISLAERGQIQYDVNRRRFKEILATRLAATPRAFAAPSPPGDSAVTTVVQPSPTEPDGERRIA